jgi:hypothetical protein
VKPPVQVSNTGGIVRLARLCQVIEITCLMAVILFVGIGLRLFVWGNRRAEDPRALTRTPGVGLHPRIAHRFAATFEVP